MKFFIIEFLDLLLLSLFFGYLSNSVDKKV